MASLVYLERLLQLLSEEWVVEHSVCGTYAQSMVKDGSGAGRGGGLSTVGRVFDEHV